MMRRLLLTFTLLLLLFAAFAAHAQTEDDRPPTIITFNADRITVSTDDLKLGAITSNLSWFVTGTDETHALTLETFNLNGFESLLEEGETLPVSGFRPVTLEPTFSFAPPTFRLAILDANRQVVDQRFLVIPYVTAGDAQVGIVDFSTEAESIGSGELSSGTARLTVSWDINNRPPRANPVFEQVLPNSENVVIELPRSFLWIPSSGTGEVAPVLPEGSDSITLRLSVVDMVDGTVYAESTLNLPIVTTEAPEATVEPSEEVQITFTAEPTTVILGENVQLMWQVTGAEGVDIGVRLPGSDSIQSLGNGLPTNMGIMIPVEGANFAGVPRATFVLRARGPQGNYIGISNVIVQIEQP